MLRLPKPVLLLLLLCAPAFSPPPLRAADFQLLPTVAEKGEYNDNLFLAPGNLTPNQKIHDYISTTSGGLHLLDKTEDLNIDATARVDQLFYRDNPSLNTTNQFYNGSVSYSVSPKLSLAFKGVYNRDATPDEFLYTSGLVLNADRRENSSENISANYTLTEKTAASLSYEHGTYWYRSTSYPNMTYDAPALSLTHDLSQTVPNLVGVLNLAYTRYSQTGLTVDNYEATTGFQYAIQEKWSFQAYAGGRRTDSSFQGVGVIGSGYNYYFTPYGLYITPGPIYGIVNQTSTGTAAVGSALLTYAGEKDSANLSFKRDIQPAYGSLGTVENTSVIFSASRKFTYELSGTLSAGYYTNVSKGAQYAATALDYTTWTASPGLRYAFNKDMYLESSYIFTQLTNGAATPTYTAYRNCFMLRFFLQHAIIE